jgi:hypothetical protein
MIEPIPKYLPSAQDSYIFGYRVYCNDLKYWGIDSIFRIRSTNLIDLAQVTGGLFFETWRGGEAGM